MPSTALEERAERVEREMAVQLVMARGGEAPVQGPALNNRPEEIVSASVSEVRPTSLTSPSETSSSESWAEMGVPNCLEGRRGQGSVLIPSTNAGRGRCGVQEVDAEKEVDAEEESGMVKLRHTLASNVIRDNFPDLFAKNLDKHIHTSFVAYDLDGSGALDKQELTEAMVGLLGHRPSPEEVDGFMTKVDALPEYMLALLRDVDGGRRSA